MNADGTLAMSTTIRKPGTTSYKRLKSQDLEKSKNILNLTSMLQLLGVTSAIRLFLNIGVLFVGVLITRALLFRVHISAPDCWKLPYTMYYTPYTLLHIFYTVLGPLIVRKLLYVDFKYPRLPSVAVLLKHQPV